MAKAASCLVRQAKSLEVPQLIASLNNTTKPLNVNAAEWIPKNNQNNNTKSPPKKYNNAENVKQTKLVMDLLTKAKTLAEAEPVARVGFEIDIIIIDYLQFYFHIIINFMLILT